MNHFIYKTYTESGKYYIGRHSTDNIDDGYLGSGKWIRSIKDKSILTREILAYANSLEELKILEEKFIQEAVNDPNNMNFNNKSVGWPTGDLNWARSPEAKIKKSQRLKGKTLPELYGEEKAKKIKEKISNSKTGTKTGKPAWNSGKPNSLETRNKISRSIIEWMDSLSPAERKEKFGNVGHQNGFFNKTHTKDTLEHLKKVQKKNRESNRKICPHCGKNVDSPNYSRHHGDKCKLKLNNPPSPHTLT